MIPLVDLSLKSSVLKEIEAAIASVIASKNYILGPQLKSFEKKFARFLGVKYAIGVASGTDALRLSLRALGIGSGDKVLIPSLTSPFTAIAVVEEGAIPVFCDVDEQTFNIDIADAQKRIDNKTKAIIPVHLFGNPCDMDAILKFARTHKIKVIEDACQAHGAKYNGRLVGTIGDAGAFSFYPTKNLGALGDGGIVVTNDRKLAEKIKLLRHGGQTKRFWHQYEGINSRHDEIQAAILEIKLKYLDKGNRARRALAKNYKNAFKNLPLSFQESPRGGQPVYHLFAVRSKNRDQLQQFLKKSGIDCDIYYPYPVHLQPAFRKYAKYKLPVSEKLAKELLAIPIGPNLKKSAQLYIIKMIKKFFGRSR